MRQIGTNANDSTRGSQQIGASSGGWSFHQNLDVTNAEFGPVMGLDLWGWGLDELLNYNGMNELSTY
jgi:hypothetical protein